MGTSSVEQGSRHATEEELKNFRRNENVLLDAISKGHASISALVLELARSMEERFNRNDPLLPDGFCVDQICSIIQRSLRSMDPPCDFRVRRVLPDKYKNMHMAREIKVIDSLNNIIEDCVQDVRNSDNARLEVSLEFLKKADHLKADLGTLLTNKIWAVRAEALRRNIKLGDETYRDQISARDYRYELPDDMDLQTANEEVIFQGQREIEAKLKFLDKYKECPATTLQDATKYANAFRVSANMFEDVVEDKWSGEMVFWFDREYWKHVQSAHKAGNSTWWPTTLCARCSANVAEDPKDFHRMKYSMKSPTGYLCDNCGGTEVLLRENTREQIGDKEANVFRDAADVLNHIPSYASIYLDWHERFKSPEIYSRKAAIREEFEDAAFGKGKIVVPRKFSANSANSEANPEISAKSTKSGKSAK